MTVRKTGAALLATAMLAGCSFVEIDPQAEEILILEAARVQDCERLGKTRVSVADQVGFVNRSEESVREDLEILARNSAADMGGDTVSPESGIEKGKQTYGVYRCIDS